MTHSDTPSQRTWRTLVGATLVSVLVFFGATAGAQTTDDPEAGGDTDQGSVDTGSEIATPAPSGGTDSGGGNLALTGGDVTGLAIIGASVAGAGAVLVIGSRRRNAAEAL